MSAKYKGGSCIKVGFFLMKHQIENCMLRDVNRKYDKTINRKGRWVQGHYFNMGGVKSCLDL